MGLRRFKIEGAEDIGSGRERLAKLRAAVVSLEKVEIAIPVELSEAIENLEDEEVEIKIPCILCERPVAHWIGIDDPVKAWPRAAVCASCGSTPDATIV